jgi:hypothetical protein
VFFNSGGSLEQITYAKGVWAKPVVIPKSTAITGSPALTMSPLGEQFVFYSDAGALQESWWNDTSWSHDPFGYAITGEPAAALNPSGHPK